MRASWIVAALLAGAAPLAAHAETAPAPAAAIAGNERDRPVLGYGLLGLEIGTAAVRARRALERQGYVLRRFETGLSWFGLLGEQTGASVERPYRKTVTAAFFDGPGGEEVGLGFVQTPRGAALSRVHLQFPATLPREQLEASLAAQFGPSNCPQGWCTQPPALPQGNQTAFGASVIADVGARTITLDATPQFQQALDHMLIAAVKDCRLARLGGGARAPENILFGC